MFFFFFFQAEDGIRYADVTGVQTCALPILRQADAYRRFANEQSLPMFRSHDGFLGVVFAEAGDERVVVTFWRDAAAAEQLNVSPRYQEIVAHIAAAGFILGPTSLNVLEVHGGAI